MSTTQNSQKQDDNDPYEGWKKYCDNSTNGCFRYPADWDDVGPLEAQGVKAFGQNKAGTISLEYVEPATGKDGLGDLVTKSISAVSATDNTLRVVGGYYSVSDVPSYHLIDTPLVESLGLVEGKTSMVDRNSGLYFSNSSSRGTFTVHLNNTSGNATISVAQVDDWFNSPDGKLALLIAQSFWFYPNV